MGPARITGLLPATTRALRMMVPIPAAFASNGQMSI
jgi:hypothetical protein